MHRDTPSCATQQPGLPPPLLSVHAQQARPLPNTPHEGHARASFRNACRRSAQTTATPLPRGVLYTSRTLDISPTSALRCTLASYWPVSCAHTLIRARCIDTYNSSQAAALSARFREIDTHND